jgi:ATP-dependent Lon protease
MARQQNDLSLEKEIPGLQGDLKQEHPASGRGRGKWLNFLAIPDLVLFPGTSIPCRVVQPERVALLERLWKRKEIFYLGAPKSMHAGLQIEDYYGVGTLAQVRKMIYLSEGEVITILEGERRATLRAVARRAGVLRAQVTPLDYKPLEEEVKRNQVLLESIKQEALDMLALVGKAPMS